MMSCGHNWNTNVRSKNAEINDTNRNHDYIDHRDT